jgi:hypothetical protein
MTRWRPAVFVALVVAVAGVARAAPDREVLPARRIERTLELPGGWTEIEAVGARSRSSRAFGVSGQGAPLLAGPWLDLGVEVRARHGWDARTEIFGWSTLGYGRIADEPWSGGAGTTGAGLVRALVQRDAPLRSVVVSGWVSGPPAAGERAPRVGAIEPGTAAVPALGGWGGGVGVAAKREIAPLSVEGSARWIGRGPARRAVEVAGQPGEATGYRLGDTIEAGATLAGQLGPFAPFATFNAMRMGPLRLRGPGGMARSEGTNSLIATARLGIEVHATRAFDVRGSSVVDLAGSGASLAPLVDGGGLVRRGCEVGVAGRF